MRELIDINDSADVESRHPLLIAHRGGVVGPGVPECSLAAIRLAAEQVYDMVELDVQQTADGVPVVFHDESLYTACGLNEEVGSLSVDEVTALKYRATDEQVTTLNAALSLCSQLRLGVMLDISASGSESYYSGSSRWWLVRPLTFNRGINCPHACPHACHGKYF